MLSRPRWPKWVGSALVAILLGAISSGVWQYAISPGLSWLFKLALDVGTLGIERFRDSLYQEMAAGNVQLSSLLTLQFTIALIGMGMGTLVGIVAGVLGRRLRTPDQSRRGYSDDDGGVDDDDVGTTLSRRRKRRLMLILWIAILLPFAGGAWTGISSTRVRYIANSQAYFGQCQAILAPHTSDAERIAWRAQFAGMRRKADFVHLVLRMEAVARERGVALPKYDVW